MKQIVCVTEKQDPNSIRMGMQWLRLDGVGGQIAHTLTTHIPQLSIQHANFVIEVQRMDRKQSFIVASRGRDPENPTSRKHADHYEQQLDLNAEGICNTLTTVRKDNLVVEVIKCK